MMCIGLVGGGCTGRIPDGRAVGHPAAGAHLIRVVVDGRLSRTLPFPFGPATRGRLRGARVAEPPDFWMIPERWSSDNNLLIPIWYEVLTRMWAGSSVWVA